MNLVNDCIIKLTSDCINCFGLCCIALYFSHLDGFPIEKEAGQPCINLQSDFSCCVHKSLKIRGYKGCIAFDCFGAGQKVSQISFRGRDWMKGAESKVQMFNVFQIMRYLHELLWYLTEALTLKAARPIYNEIRSLLEETETITYLDTDILTGLDVHVHRGVVNKLLLKVSELVRKEYKASQKIYFRGLKPGVDLIAADLRKYCLVGANLRGACLIAADLRGADLKGVDFIGADFRDTDIRGADLSESIFLTPAQINSAKGDFTTKLPPLLSYPLHWEDPQY